MNAKNFGLIENFNKEKLMKSYIEVQKEIANLKKLKELLNEQIKLEMGELNVLGAGDYVATLKDRSRTDIDRDLLREMVGEEILKEVTKSTQYKILTVVKA